MKVMFVVAMLCLFAAPAMADVTKSDMKKLIDAGMSDPVMLEYIKAKAPVRMTANDLVELKKLGASDKVLAALAHAISDKAIPAPQQETMAIFRTEPNGYYYPYGGWGYGWVGGWYRCYSGRCGHVGHCGPRPVAHPTPGHGGGRPGGHCGGHGGHR